MLVVTTNKIEGKTIVETLGLVQGAVVQSKHIGKDIMASFKTIVGGEIKGYTEMLVEARKTALDKMVEEAKKLKADAVVGVRYASSDVAQAAAEVLVYGTAVKIK